MTHPVGAAIQFSRVSKSFGPVDALRQLDFEAPYGSITVLLGPNGAGKTTTVRLTTGALNADAGSISVLDLDPATGGTEIRSRCGIVPPKPAFYDELSGWDNLQFAARIFDASDAAALEELIDVLPSDELACAAPTQATFPRAWAAVLPAEKSAKRAWILPPDAKWENLVFEFEAEEMLRVTFRQETRSFEPIDLGMRDHRDKRPTDQWALLKILAVCNGVLDYTPEVRTQKKFLSDKLRSSFGISEDPIPYDRRSNQYRARFIIRGAVLRDLSKRCQFA